MSLTYEVLSCCCICLSKTPHNLLQVTEPVCANKNNSYIEKLKKCVSEVDWSEEYLICETCRKQLETVYDFHVLCIQSHETRSKVLCLIVTSDIKTENLFSVGEHKNYDQTNSFHNSFNGSHVNEGFMETDMAFCNVCHLSFKDQTALKQHEIMHADNNFTNEDTGDSILDNEGDLESELSNSETITLNEAVCRQKKNLDLNIDGKRSLNEAVCSQKKNLDLNIDGKSQEKLEPFDENIKQPRQKRKRSNKFPCEICHQMFNTSTKLIQHTESEHCINKDDVKPFACLKCPMRFNRTYGLTTHAKVHKKTKSCIICDMCNNKYDNASDLVEHCVDVHNINDSDVKPYSCMQCTQRFRNTLHLKQHVKSHVKEEYSITRNNIDTGHNIIDSDASVPVEISKVSENITVKKKNIFICEICGKNFHYCTKLVKHMVTEHNMDKKDVKPFICTQCSKRFDKNTLLIQHMKFHNGVRNAICPYCGKAFITKGELHIHEKIHLNKREYQCTLCPKRFNTSGDRNRHKLVVHTDPSLWRFVCDICTKRLPSKSHHDTHMRRHNNDKPFACHLCEKRFCDKIVLQKHLRSHSNVRPYKCSECDKEYKDERTMLLHMARIHKTGNIKVPERIKKYICHLCPKSYYDKGKLTKHLYTHTGERPFACTICNKKFTDKSYVKHHMKSVHNFVADAVEATQ